MEKPSVKCIAIAAAQARAQMDIEMADLEWAEEIASAFADETAQMNIDSGGTQLSAPRPRLHIYHCCSDI